MGFSLKTPHFELRNFIIAFIRFSKYLVTVTGSELRRNILNFRDLNGAILNKFRRFFKLYSIGNFNVSASVAINSGQLFSDGLNVMKKAGMPRRLIHAFTLYFIDDQY